MRHSYRIKDFAALGGVTVKALLHYDRLGLLTPSRTTAGHRVYAARDLEQLRRVLALKRAGVALTRMRVLLDAGPAALAAHLDARREGLAQEQDRLRRSDRALALVEESLRHAPDDERGLSRLADVFEMPQAVAQMKRYFSDEVWEAAKRFYEDWPTPPWIALCRDLTAAIEKGTGDAEALQRRWNELARSFWQDFSGDHHASRQLHEGLARAWRARDQWPDPLKSSSSRMP